MKLSEIFPNEVEFMDWLTNNCYSCTKLPNNPEEYNYVCELEPIISYVAMDEEFDDKLAQLITENGKLCKCKNFVESKN